MARSRKRKKQPRAAVDPPLRKVPSTGPVVPALRKIPGSVTDRRQYGSYHPAWRFSMFDVQGPFGFEALNRTDTTALVRKLASLESMTWGEIFKAKKRNHPNSTERFAPEARKRLRQIELDDFEQLHSLRLGGKARIYGIWREGAFYLIWWDPDHRVYPVVKKHT